MSAGGLCLNNEQMFHRYPPGCSVYTLSSTRRVSRHEIENIPKYAWSMWCVDCKPPAGQASANSIADSSPVVTNNKHYTPRCLYKQRIFSGVWAVAESTEVKKWRTRSPVQVEPPLLHTRRILYYLVAFVAIDERRSGSSPTSSRANEDPQKYLKFCLLVVQNKSRILYYVVLL